MSPSEILKDLRRNWHSCWVFVQFPDTSATSLFNLVNISADVPAQITLQSQRYGNLIINLGSDYQLHFKSPITGVFQSGREAIVVTKKFGTGYSRGINATNTMFRSVLQNYHPSEDIGDMGVASNKLEQIINDMFEQNHTRSLSRAIECLEYGDFLSVAVDRSFAISRSLYGPDGYTVFYRNLAVAEIAKDCKLTSIKVPVFETSIKRLINADSNSHS